MRTRNSVVQLNPIIFLMLVSLANQANAGLETWSAPGQISGDFDVLTNGNLLYAVGFGSGGEVVNGELFNGFGAPGVSSTITEPASQNTFGGFNGESPAYGFADLERAR